MTTWSIFHVKNIEYVSFIDYDNFNKIHNHVTYMIIIKMIDDTIFEKELIIEGELIKYRHDNSN